MPLVPHTNTRQLRDASYTTLYGGTVKRPIRCYIVCPFPARKLRHKPLYQPMAVRRPLPDPRPHSLQTRRSKPFARVSPCKIIKHCFCQYPPVRSHHIGHTHLPNTKAHQIRITIFHITHPPSEKIGTPNWHPRNHFYHITLHLLVFLLPAYRMQRRSAAIKSLPSPQCLPRSTS